MEKSNTNTLKRSILIVEDNFINRELLIEILGDNYNTIEAENGLIGLEELSKHYEEISLILLDVQMPVLDGYGFLAEFKKVEKYSGIPIIVTTAKDTDEEEKCLSLGATDYVRKPYNPNILLKRISGLISLRESVTMLQIAKYDFLTKIYTKNIFTRYADDFLKYNKNTNYTLLLFGLEDFALYNDYYGGTIIEELLVHIGDSLRTLTSEGLLYARFSYDEFSILFDNEKHDLYDLINRIKSLISENKFGKYSKIKFAYYPNVSHTEPISSIYSNLSFALLEIKHQYNNDVIMYEDKMTEKAVKIKNIESCMENALKNNEFKVYYQPKVCPFTNKIKGAEALVRWVHPTLGFISPGDFIPIFETNGFILKLDNYVWEKVVDDISNWKELGLPLVPVSVNASRQDFIISKDIDFYLNTMKKKDVNCDLMHLELTESACANKEEVFPLVNKLREYGIHIEIDDFGSGYSSLGMIKEMPMDILKLDISFSRSLDKQKEVVELIIDLAHKLNAKIVAEGVETLEQIDILKDLNCDYIQGYYYSKPLPEADFREYLKEHA